MQYHDQELRTVTLGLARSEKDATLKLLKHLNEVKRRRVFSDWQHSSLFKYVTAELGYSESDAQRKIKAAEAIEVMPEIAKKIQKGELNLTTVSMASGVITGKGNESTKKASHKLNTKDKKKKFVKSLEGKTQAEAAQMIGKLKGDKAKEKTKTRTQVDNTLRVSVTLGVPAQKSLKYLSDRLAGRGLFDRKDIIEYALSYTAEGLQRVEERLGTRKGRVTTNARTIPAKVKATVIKRSGNKCEKCASPRNLEFDHLIPFGMGGFSHTEENVRHLCRNCNQREAIKAYGQKKMDPHLN